MIPKKPLNYNNILDITELQVEFVSYNKEFTPEVIICVAYHHPNQPIEHCLKSIAMQNLNKERVLVLILNDGDGCILKHVNDYKYNLNIKLIRGSFGSAAKVRNSMLDYIENCYHEPIWVARLDADDQFADSKSLESMLKMGQQTQAKFVLGSNLLSINGIVIGANPANDELKKPEFVVERLCQMATGTAVNELPSCNLMFLSHQGIRYPQVKSAEDHWLVADLLINRTTELAFLESPNYAIYKLNGNTTNQNIKQQEYLRSRQHLHNHAEFWLSFSKNDKLIGYGMEGIVTLDKGQICKHFYPNSISDEKVEWLQNLHFNSFILPKYSFQKTGNHWQYLSIFIESIGLDNVQIDIVRNFLIECHRLNIAPLNIKRQNLRLTSSNQLVYIDIGNDIEPLTASNFIDISARLYAICILKWPDGKLFRHNSPRRQEDVLALIPGFDDFYKDLIEQCCAGIFNRNNQSIKLKCNVTLLIKCCTMDHSLLLQQVQHIVASLERPMLFSKKIMLVDTYSGPFLRQFDEPDLTKTLTHLQWLVENGVIDEFVLAPSDSNTTSNTNNKWFALPTPETHTNQNVPTSGILWAFDMLDNPFVLQCDVDVLIGRKNYSHNYLEEMISALQAEEKVFGIGFNIAKPSNIDFEQYSAPTGKFVPEVRLGLFDLNRLKAQRPYPNSLINNKLELSWYRSIEKYQSLNGWKSLRGGDHRTFYIHPPNNVKKNLDFITKVRNNCEIGYVPKCQHYQWDLVHSQSSWEYPTRSEPVVFLIKGRNIPTEKFQRCFTSLKYQTDQSFGLIIIDDQSDNSHAHFIVDALDFLSTRTTFIRRPSHLGRMPNFIEAIKRICDNQESLIVILDMDDALMTDNVVQLLLQYLDNGHDLIQAGVYRPDKPLKQYRPNYTNVRAQYGNDVWSHLRSFKKRLFDAIPEEYFQIDGQWITECTDYATMVPLVELASKPVFIDSYFYFHDRHNKTPSKQKKSRIIQDIISKPSLTEN